MLFNEEGYPVDNIKISEDHFKDLPYIDERLAESELKLHLARLVLLYPVLSDVNVDDLIYAQEPQLLDMLEGFNKKLNL